MSEKRKTIVKVVRSSYWNGRSLVFKIEVIPLKKKCVHFDSEEFMQISGEGILINNLSEVVDGTYRMVPCNVSRDWETGVIDGWEYQLIPYKGE